MALSVAYCKGRFRLTIDIACTWGAKLLPAVRRDPGMLDFNRLNSRLSTQCFMSVLVSEFCIGRVGGVFREGCRGEGRSEIRHGQDSNERKETGGKLSKRNAYILNGKMR